MPAVTQAAFDSVYAVKEAEICNKALARISADVIKDTSEDTKQSRAVREVYTQTRDELLRMYPFNFATKSTKVPLDSAYPHPTGEFSYAYKAEDHVSFNGTCSTASVITAISGLVVREELIGRVVKGTNIQANTRIIAVDTTLGAETITLDRPSVGVASGLSVHIPILKFLEVGHNDENIFELTVGGEGQRILCNILGDLNAATSVNELEIKYAEQVIDPDKFDTMFKDALALRIASKVCVTLTTNAALTQVLQQEFASIMQLAQNTSSQERQVDSSEPWWADRQSAQAIQTRR